MFVDSQGNFIPPVERPAHPNKQYFQDNLERFVIVTKQEHTTTRRQRQHADVVSSVAACTAR
jgi:hypothetical protein